MKFPATLLLICAMCTGCTPHAMYKAHKLEADLLTAYKEDTDNLYEAALQDGYNDWSKRMDLVEAAQLIAASENGAVPLESLAKIKEDRKIAEKITQKRLNGLREKWAEAGVNFDSAKELHEAIGKWLGIVDLWPNKE